MTSIGGLRVHSARIHRPPLRDDVLSRERLNRWLDEAATGRVVLIVAEAGFGKTTLLADWSRQTPRRTLWYRLEPDDRDWLVFLRHLVASGLETDPAFAPETLGLLSDVGPGGPTPAAVVDALLRELVETGAADPHGLTLIFDDYHNIDGSEDTDPIVRAILERTGPGLSVILGSRSTPHLPLGRLRARRAVARLDGDALSFDRSETDRLFREAYRHPLEADVVADLAARTEGWPALLSLVRTNLEERPTADVRAFVHNLSGAGGELHDYLAEEVVGGLPPRLQKFLMRVSILDSVDARSAAIAASEAGDDSAVLLGDAERLGLLTAPEAASPHRFHPLVRAFLLARLDAEIGEPAVKQLHRQLGREFEASNWAASASQYLAADDGETVRRVIEDAIDSILASGQFEDTRPFLPLEEDDGEAVVSLILRSRVELARGNPTRATALAQSALIRSRKHNGRQGVALLNLASVQGVTGFTDDAVESARQAISHELTASQRDVAVATIDMWEASREGSLEAIANRLAELAVRQERARHSHYVAVTKLNLASILYWMGRVQESLSQATQASLILAQSAPDSVEAVAATAARALALAHIGHYQDAERLLEVAARTGSAHGRLEALVEWAGVAVRFGPCDRASTLLKLIGTEGDWPPGMSAVVALARIDAALRVGDVIAGRLSLDLLTHIPCNDVAGQLRTRLATARVFVQSGDPAASVAVEALRDLAKRQDSRPGKLLATLLSAVLKSGTSIDAAVLEVANADAPILSMAAEEVAFNLHRVKADAASAVHTECVLRPERWRSALLVVIQRRADAAMDAATLLADVGTAADLCELRDFARTNRRARDLVVRLARRVAPVVRVEDLGPVKLLIGGDAHPGRLRRKVLALLCYLISRRSMAATRDEVLEALWPDLRPETAANSLNQTIFFLRRVIEPDYREGLGAGYVRFDGEMVSLDVELVTAASREVRQLLSAGPTSVDVARTVTDKYVGKFAMDFAYEEWTSHYRDTLHAGVLAYTEAAAADATRRGDFDAAIALAHSVLAIDPAADALELLLLRAYRMAGHHSAAAEQYAHYASVQRDQLGVEPPPLADL